MKLKKYSYLIAIVLMLLIGINNVKATTTDVNKTCYYIGNDKQVLAKLEIKDGSRWMSYSIYEVSKAYSEVFINKWDKRIGNESENIINWYDSFEDDETGIELAAMNDGKRAAKKSHKCPEYLMLRVEKDYSSYGAYASNSEMIAKRFVEKSNATGNFKTAYLTYKDSNGNEYTSEDYYGHFVTMNPDDIYVPGADIQCSQLFGDKHDDGETNDVNGDGTASIAYMIDSVLQYVRVIVPMLIIVLGVIDLSKAVISSKEDEMRKTQKTFIKRILLGLVVFFVPLIVNVIMDLADIVWETSGYSGCRLE